MGKMLVENLSVSGAEQRHRKKNTHHNARHIEKAQSLSPSDFIANVVPNDLISLMPIK
jgi:hypothetical protein